MQNNSGEKGRPINDKKEIHKRKEVLEREREKKKRRMNNAGNDIVGREEDETHCHNFFSVIYFYLGAVIDLQSGFAVAANWRGEVIN